MVSYIKILLGGTTWGGRLGGEMGCDWHVKWINKLADGGKGLLSEIRSRRLCWYSVGFYKSVHEIKFLILKQYISTKITNCFIKEKKKQNFAEKVLQHTKVYH